VLGLGLSHGPADLARGLVDGIVFESRRCLDVLEESGLPRSPLRIAGAGASSPFFRRRLADASGRRVLYARDATRPFSALGAARIAAEANGGAPAGDDAWSGPFEATEPDGSRREEWERRWARYRELVDRARRLYARG
jgi:xylulokinase